MDNGKLLIEIIQFWIEHGSNNYSSDVIIYLLIIFQAICTTFIATTFVTEIDL
jgi:hypothetical protein